MSDAVSLASLFEAAEHAAVAGDFAAAARALGEAARAQQAALGPDHPDLANTLNNLAVAHERCGQLDDAEREYRRSHAIAARVLPADDPLVATSLLNLREFCEANGRPLDVPALRLAEADDAAATIVLPRPPASDPPTVPIEPLSLTFAAEPAAKAAAQASAPGTTTTPVTSAPRGSQPPAATAKPPAPSRPSAPVPQTGPVAKTGDVANTGRLSKTGPDVSAAPVAPVATSPAAGRVPAPPAAPPAAPTAATAPRTRPRLSVLVWIAIGAVIGLILWLLAGRGPAAPADAPAPPADGTTPPPTAGPATSAPAPPPAATTAPAVSAPRQTPAPSSSPAAATAAPASRAATPAATSAGGITVGDAQLCTVLSGNYRCTAAGSTVRPGPLVFYTRLIADRSTSVVHRWYRGDQVRQSVRLDVPARRQGFRTYSRTTVAGSGDEWRVELRTRDGQLLHTERFTVR